jgi:cellulose synthase/poly-beta-1,6-N-acetylglucosamine synthase-like glycosyltransferase
LEIIVPVKGQTESQKRILASLLLQEYKQYRVMFVVETSSDPANQVVNDLCEHYAHAFKIVSGKSRHCAQKNFNLIKGIQALDEKTELIVFCDSTNEVGPNWLKEFTFPLRDKACDVVTTFRGFKPEPENIWAVSQAIYGTLLLLLMTLAPRPWGGATGIRRSLVSKLNVAEAWSNTVVDDLVLGNVLEKAGCKTLFQPQLALKSPLFNQTFRQFADYLNRQLLFPKFTNPGIWLGTTIIELNFATCLAAVTVVAFIQLLGSMHWASWWVLALPPWVVAIGTFWLRKYSLYTISSARWVLGTFVLIAVAGIILARSIFVKYIEWHGIKYWTTSGGVVVGVERLGAE